MILMIPGNRPNRRGVTLIEMLVVMTVLAVLLGLCALTIQLLLRVGSDAQSRRSAASALGRLSAQFREDVHACDGAEVRHTAGLRLSRDRGVVITYEARDGRVDRVEAIAGQARRHESYDLGRGAAAAFERRDDDGPGRFLALVVSRTTQAGRPDPPRPVEILALAGKDRPESARAKGGQDR
jgi:prepilin-type N-terminal cleavage/methylation domain-containing protein